MFSSFATGPSRKRPRQEASKQTSNKNGKGDSNTLCNFCGQMTAAVTVDMPVSVGRKRTPTPYCLMCYYTTTAVRQDPQKFVHTLDETALQEQLPPMQDLFSQVYVDLSKEVAEASEKAFAQMKDPLASLRGTATRVTSTSSAPRRMTPQELAAKKAGKDTDGGFLRPVKVPLHLASPTNKASGSSNHHVQSSITSFMTTDTNRRKPSRKSIWNLAMDKTIRTEQVTTANPSNAQLAHDSVCTCGSKNVQLFGNMTSRNQDLKKGETWGMKDRGEDVVSRYQCNDCGKQWNEEG